MIALRSGVPGSIPGHDTPVINNGTSCSPRARGRTGLPDVSIK